MMRIRNTIGVFINTSSKSAINGPLSLTLRKFLKNSKRLKSFSKFGQRLTNIISSKSPKTFVSFAFKAIIALGTHKRDQAERFTQQQNISILENNFEQLRNMQRLMQERSDELQRKEQELIKQREAELKRLREDEEKKLIAREEEFQRQREFDQKRLKEDAARRELEDEHRRQREVELKEQLELLKRQREEESKLRKEKEEELVKLQKEDQRRRLNIDETEIGAILSKAVQSSIGLITQELTTNRQPTVEKIEDFELLHTKPRKNGSATLRPEDMRNNNLTQISAAPAMNSGNPMFKTMPASIFKTVQEESESTSAKEIEFMNEEMKEKINRLTGGEILEPEENDNENDGGYRDSQNCTNEKRRMSERKDQQRKNISQKKERNDRYGVSGAIQEQRENHSRKGSQDSKAGGNKRDINIYREARKRKARGKSNVNEEEGDCNKNNNSMNELSQVLPYKSKSVNNSDSELFCEEVSPNSSFCKEISKIDFFGKKATHALQRKIDFHEHVELALDKSNRSSIDKNEIKKRASSLSGKKKTHGPKYLKPAKNSENIAPSSVESVKDYTKKYKTLTEEPSEKEELPIYSKTLNNQFYTDIREISENDTPIRRNQADENADGVYMELAEPIELETSPKNTQNFLQRQLKKEQPNTYVDIYKHRNDYYQHSRNPSNEMKNKGNVSAFGTQLPANENEFKKIPFTEFNRVNSTKDLKQNKNSRQIGINTKEDPEMPKELKSKRDESAPAKLGMKSKPGELVFKQNFSPIKKSPSTVFETNTYRTEFDDIKSVRSRDQEAANFENYLTNFNKQKYSKTIDFNFERHLKENSPGKNKCLEESRASSTRNKNHPIGGLSFSQSNFMNKSMVGKKSPSFNSSFCAKGSNMQKVIENQKKYIGDSFKTLHGASTGRLLSPTYQEYLARKKTNSMASLSPERNAGLSRSPARK